MQKARLKSDGYTCRTVRRRLADGGSNPPSSTIHKTPTVLGWGFFLSVRNGSRVFARVLAETCGLHSSTISPVLGHLSLSPGHFSLQPRSPRMAQSPQRPNPASFQINGLRADESSGCFMALPGDGNRLDSESGEGRDRPQTEGQLPAEGTRHQPDLRKASNTSTGAGRPRR